jgi:hypothetical protein
MAGVSAAAKRPTQDKKNASLKAGETTRKNQKEGPDRKGKNQEQDMKQETMGNQWAVEKVRLQPASSMKLTPHIRSHMQGAGCSKAYGLKKGACMGANCQAPQSLAAESGTRLCQGCTLLGLMM